ncbi:MAG TPA: HAMP domain-containing sensor histidine kinase [Paucimonas sp.]|nr:HAMP domain-containing sensor histidine kinase [Paucimonas sp.]
MYSLLPALVSSAFLGYGTYVVCTKGLSRITLALFAVCLASSSWQGAWAILFQVRDPQLALFLAKFGYLFILFLPTTLYHYLVEIAGCTSERRYVYLSYAFAALLVPLLILTDLIVAGNHDYFWGFYPKAGMLHPVHLLQTVLVIGRVSYVVHRQRDNISPAKRIKLNLSLGGVLVYVFATVNYAGAYGIEFYPPGAIFIAISLGVIALVTASRHNLLNPMAAAATVTHELRTPLLSIRMQAKGLERHLPALVHGYRLAVERGLCEPSVHEQTLGHLSSLGQTINQEIDRTNIALDMLLAYIKTEQFDKSGFARHLIGDSIAGALNRYVFDSGERARVEVARLEEFEFHGSDTLLILVLFNLLKNSLYAIRAAGKGTIRISTKRGAVCNQLHFKDTGIGIPKDALPHLFDAFFTTKKAAGSGLGLAFCKRVMTSFGGNIRCDSVAGEYTLFVLEFPNAEEKGQAPQLCPAVG